MNFGEIDVAIIENRNFNEKQIGYTASIGRQWLGRCAKALLPGRHKSGTKP